MEIHQLDCAIRFRFKGYHDDGETSTDNRQMLYTKRNRANSAK